MVSYTLVVPWLLLLRDDVGVRRPLLNCDDRNWEAKSRMLYLHTVTDSCFVQKKMKIQNVLVFFPQMLETKNTLTSNRHPLRLHLWRASRQSGGVVQHEPMTVQ